MAASRVVLYFEKPEDAVQFTVAASSMISADEQEAGALAKVGMEISKASRIMTGDKIGDDAPGSLEVDGRCA